MNLPKQPMPATAQQEPVFQAYSRISWNSLKGFQRNSEDAMIDPP